MTNRPVRVVMPQAELYREAETAFVTATTYWPFLEPMMVWLPDPQGYARLMAELWRGGRAFVIVEHDVVIDAAKLHELLSCPEPWCGFPYLQVPDPNSEPVLGLGFTKFERKALEVLPDMPERLDGAPWQNVHYITSALHYEAGLTQHRHEPPVRNLKAEEG